MKFSTLFNKLGKQPIKNTQSSDIIAVFDVEELKELINENKHMPTINIPLDIKFGNGSQKMWFIRKK